MDEITIGARLRTLRRWRGMTQVELAGLAGLSPSFVSMVETGQRPLDRRSHIAAVASALRVSETDLVGGPHLSADRQQADPHQTIPALREALQTNKLNGPSVDHARPLAELARVVNDRIEPVRANADYVRAGALLPGVLDELYWHVAQPGDGASRRLALETLIEACVMTGLTAKDLGYLDLAYVAVLRAEEAAALLDDPVQRGKADCLRIWAFPRERSWERRLAAAESAAEALEPHAHSSLGIQVLGILTLHAALGAAVVQRTHVVDHWLAEASELSRRVPDDIRGNWQSFSQTNVRLWNVAIGVERGESGGTVLDLAGEVDESKITYRNRQACFLADVGRGLAREPRTRTEAVRWLRRAEDAGPQLIRNHPPTREAVAYLLNRARADAGGRELRGMAARMGVPH
ncbi:MAG TPA: helix-turn-helix transcriptional regulator [Streptosporangiaceae bacterium]|nr:helix-turn-helix transcriptional regulator [Streptosporangiaceae bacterium]